MKEADMFPIEVDLPICMVAGAANEDDNTDDEQEETNNEKNLLDIEWSISVDDIRSVDRKVSFVSCWFLMNLLQRVFERQKKMLDWSWCSTVQSFIDFVLLVYQFKREDS